MKKEIRDWVIVLGIFGILYVTGLFTDVAAFTQRMVLATGVIRPTELSEAEKVPAEYDFKLYNLEGELYDFEKNKGKVVFINFWASWCAPCIAEMPNIQSLYDQYKDNPDIEFVLISLDRDPEKAKKYINKKKYSLPYFFPDYETLIPKVYEAPSIPTTYVLSPAGMIDSKKVGMANYDTKSFRRYLDKLIAKTGK